MELVYNAHLKWIYCKCHGISAQMCGSVSENFILIRFIDNKSYSVLIYFLYSTILIQFTNYMLVLPHFLTSYACSLVMRVALLV